MLRNLHNKKLQKKIWLILIIVIGPPFILWGSGSIIKSQKENISVGKIYGKKVSSQEYQDAMRATRSQLMMQMGDNFSQFEKFLDIRALAWERLVLLREANKQGIRISDKDVVAFITTNPSFQKKGVFDRGIYEYVVKYALRLQPRTFEEQIRQNLIIVKLYNQMTDKITVTDTEIRQAYEKENEQISVSYIAGLFGDFETQVNVTDEQLMAFYTANPQEFKKPYSYKVDFISTDSEPQTVGATSLLEQKQTLENVAKSFDLQIKESEWFFQDEPITGIGWSPEIIKELSKLEKGQVLIPAALVDKKYYIIRLKDKKDPFVPEFETVKDKAKELLLQKKAKELARTKIDACLAKLKQTPTAPELQSIAQEYGLKSADTQPFKFGEYLAGIGQSDIFFNAIRALKTDEFSPVLEMPTGFYIIKLKSRQPIDEQKFAQEKQTASAKLLNQKKQESFAKLLEEWKKNTIQPK